MEKMSAQKEDDVKKIIGLIISGVIVYFCYKWFLNPLGNILGVSRIWQIGFSIFLFFVGFGFWVSMQNTLGFFEKANKKLTEDKSENSSITKRLQELKKLKEDGIISDKEFKKKREDILRGI